jgi:hypothetical protein
MTPARRINAFLCAYVKDLFLEQTKIEVDFFEYLGITFSKKGIDANKHVAILCSNARKRI